MYLNVNYCSGSQGTHIHPHIYTRVSNARSRTVASIVWTLPLTQLLRCHVYVFLKYPVALKHVCGRVCCTNECLPQLEYIML